MNLLIIGGLVVLILGAAVYFVVRPVKPKKAKGDDSWLEQRLEVEKLQSDIILNAIEDGVVVIDAHKTIRLFNPAASRLTGWPQDEALGLNYTSVLKLVDEKGQPYSDFSSPFMRTMQSAKTVRDNNAALLSRSDKQLSVNLGVSPLFDKQHQVSGVVGIFRDVSEERQEERQRAEFISTASHEMRTPVAAIEGYLALAMNDKVSQIDFKARAYLEKAHESTQHLGRLFQDLLTSARAEDGRLSNHPIVVDMAPYLEKLTDDLRFAAEKKGLSLEYIIGTDESIIDASAEGSRRIVTPLYYVQVDPDRMREVITNLYDNAVKFTDTGKISIGLTGNQEVVQIYVRDTGPGIPPEDIPHLFQKFYRVDSSATRTIGGTGLGLFISRKIVELYSGRVWAESTVGKGSTFFINLPRLTTQKAKELQAAEASSNSVHLPEITSPDSSL